MPNKINGRVCASLESLMQIKDVTEDDAKEIRRIWHTVAKRKEARAQIDQVLRTHGVEYLGQHKRTGEHVRYCNAGDSYDTTILFSGLRLWVGTWADLIEANRIKEHNHY